MSRTQRCIVVAAALIVGAMWAQAEARADVVFILNCRIERTWTPHGQNWLVQARAYWAADGAYICQRSYVYLGNQGDSRDLNTLRMKVFDTNGNNYIDCLEFPVPEFEEGCSLPDRREDGPPFEQ